MKTFNYKYLIDYKVSTQWLNKISKIVELNVLLNVKEKLDQVSKVTSKNCLNYACINAVKLDSKSKFSDTIADGYKRVRQKYNKVNFNLSDEVILDMQELLMRDYPYNFERGIYQSSDNVMLETDVYGSRKIRIMPLAAADTPQVMKNLFSAYNAVKDEIHPLLLIPCFILDFLCIHPFMHANGHMSRLLTYYMLQSFGYTGVNYFSIEEYILSHQDDYFASLQISSEEWLKGDNNIFAFVDYYLNMILNIYKKIQDSESINFEKKTSKTDRIESILLNSNKSLSKMEIASKCPDISITLIEIVLSNMLKRGQIKKIGSNKNARYVLN